MKQLIKSASWSFIIKIHRYVNRRGREFLFDLVNPIIGRKMYKTKKNCSTAANNTARAPAIVLQHTENDDGNRTCSAHHSETKRYWINFARRETATVESNRTITVDRLRINERIARRQCIWQSYNYFKQPNANCLMPIDVTVRESILVTILIFSF